MQLMAKNARKAQYNAIVHSPYAYINICNFWQTFECFYVHKYLWFLTKIYVIIKKNFFGRNGWEGSSAVDNQTIFFFLARVISTRVPNFKILSKYPVKLEFLCQYILQGVTIIVFNFCVYIWSRAFGALLSMA